MTKHTAEPWVAIEHGDIGSGWWSVLKGAWDVSGNQASNPGVVADSKYSAMLPDENAANAKRIVACINACEGINPKAVPGLLKAARGARAALTQNKTHPADIAAALAFLNTAITKTEKVAS